VASTYSNIGILWKNKGEYDKALEFYRNCLDILLKSFGPEHLDVASTKNKIDEVLKLMGD
jgi:tetratricopeptide (TPR) repeat protein